MNQFVFPQLPEQSTSGITLRDYFAAMAMNGIISKHKLEDFERDRGMVCEFIVSDAYELADWMLAQRKK